MSSKKKTTAPGLSNAAKTLGHAGGLKGGPARAHALTAAQRQEIASKGGKARRKKH